MNVPCRLAWREASNSRPDAQLLLSEHVSDLVTILQEFNHSQLPNVFSVAGGFLIVSPLATAEHHAGTIRMRKLDGEVYIPIDAELIPSFLPDELEALSKTQGLIFLPRDQILSFDRSDPLTPDRLLCASNVVRNDWQPFPTRPELPDRIFRIEWPTPPAAVIEILSQGQPDDADPFEAGNDGSGKIPDEIRPPKAGIGAKIISGTEYMAAGILTAMAKLFQAPNLAKWGAKLAQRAIERVPRISEKLLGAQEAALREILRQLKKGDIEKVLRKAPIAVADPNQSGKVDTSSNLSERDIRFSLRDLIAGGSGGASTWLGGGDVWNQLAQEYRRLAIEAIKKGDYRRAAYLYGVLLRDLHAAAQALEQGGYDRDAAILYRDKLNNATKAAAAFEKTGDSDEAIRLYLTMLQFEKAGDLARRVGDDDQAIELYQRAVKQHADSGRYLDAGNLARTKLGQHELSMSHYRTGWEKGKVDSLICGTWYFTGLLGERNWPAANSFLDEAEVVLAPPLHQKAGSFFNQIRSVVSDVVPKSFQDDLDDRTKLFFARHLREFQTNPKTAQELFGKQAAWPAPVVRDAIAATTRTKATSTAPHTPSPIHIVDGEVLHAIASQTTRDLVIATNSSIVIWRPESETTSFIMPVQNEQILGISVSGSGRNILVLMEIRNNIALHLYRGQNQIEKVSESIVLNHTEWNSSYLSPDFIYENPRLETIEVLIDGVSYRFRKFGLIPIPVDDTDVRLEMVLKVNGLDHHLWEWSAREITQYRIQNEVLIDNVLGRPGWRPKITESNYRHLDWITPAANALEITGVSDDEDLFWTECQADAMPGKTLRTASSTKSIGYRASCLLAPGLIAAATNDNVIHWLRPNGIVMTHWAKPTPLNVPTKIFNLISRSAANEVIAVLMDGSAVRIPKPR